MSHTPELPHVGTRVELWCEFLVDEIQQIAMSGVTGGTFDATHRGKTANLIPWDATALDLREALEALPNIGLDGLITYGGPLPATPIKIRWAGHAIAKRNHPLITANTTLLTGAGPAATITTIQAGGLIEPDGAVTLAVDDPDGGAPTTVVPTSQGQGVWRGLYTPTKPGVHRYLYTAASTIFGTIEIEDVFTVAPRLVA